MWTQRNNALVSGDWIIREVSDECILASAYMDMLVAGTPLESLFPLEPPSLSEFLRWYTPPASNMLAAWYKRPDADVMTLGGLGFTNKTWDYGCLKKGEVAFLFTERMGAPNKSVFRRIQLCEGFISAAFVLVGLDSIVGEIPEPHGGSVALAARLGLTVVGPVPNYCVWSGRPCGAFIVQTDAQTWLNGDHVVLESK